MLSDEQNRATGQAKTAPAPLSGWLAEAVTKGASDLHLVAGHSPVLRLHGELRRLDEPAVTDAELRPLMRAICPDSLFREFEQTLNLDFSHEEPINGLRTRFRVNLFVNEQNIGACLRMIPSEIPEMQWAGFPPGLAGRLSSFRNGLVLITGVTGSGKTTTLAMIVNSLNSAGNHRILTIEEPVEYRYPSVSESLVTQREVGVDCHSFADGLRYGLRQDPDVILVGEIRDRDTGQMALTAAETGHLVFSTLHTRDARGAISRYADLFPQSVQPEIRAQLATSLRAVVTQHLLPSAMSGEKRQLALEVLFNNSPVSAAIRSGKLQSIDNCILTGRSDGMIPLSESVRQLLNSDRIDQTTADRFLAQ